MTRKDVWNAVHAWNAMDPSERVEFVDLVNAAGQVTEAAIHADAADQAQ